MLQSFFQDYDLYINALVASILISYASAPIGVFLNLKRMTLMGEAISHSLLPGFALAFMFYGMSYAGLILGGLFAGILVLGLMMGLDRFVTIKEDGVLTVVYLTFSAFGLLIVLNSGIKIDLSHILVGNILLIDNVWLGILFVSSLLIRFTFSRIQERLLIVLMDPEYAQFLGIRIQQIKGIFYFLVLWILVLCFYSVGTQLSLGLLLIPALIAKVRVKTLGQQIKWSLINGVIISILGLYYSVRFDSSTGPTIIVVGGILFVFSIFGKSKVSGFIMALLIVLLGMMPAKAALFSSVHPRDQILVSTPYLKLFINHLVTPTDKMAIETLIPMDQSVHTYQLKPSDLKKLKQAKVFIFVGNSLEENLKDQIIKVNSEVVLVDITANSKKGSKINEHFWLNPEELPIILENLKAAFSAERPELSATLKERTSAAKAQLAEYLKSAKERFQPYKGHSILISHNSLYFLNDLIGLNVRYYTNGSGPSDVMTLKKVLKDKGTPVLKEYGSVNFLFESLVKEQQRAYSGEVYGEVFPSELFESKTYLDLLKVNLDVIFQVLNKKT